jgi:hypothetical protein
MNQTEARRLAEAHVHDGMVVLNERSAECEFGFYFAVDSRKHQETGRCEDILVGSCGVLVDRANGNVHPLGAAFPLEYWFEAYRRHLHLPCAVVVTKVRDRQRAAESLLRLQMSFVVPEEAHGTVWRVPQHYGLKDFLRSFEKLPARFEKQKLIFRLHEIEKIEKGGDILDAFTFWVCTRFSVPDGSMDWAGHIWRHCGEDDEAAFRLFFELLEEYVSDRELHGADAIKNRFMEMMQKR